MRSDGADARFTEARTGSLTRPQVAEFFAGIGLVRVALETAQLEVVFANDIEPSKRAVYSANFGDDHFVLGDVRDITADDIPDVALATASFPCVDLSLAGNRKGLAGGESGMFWEFARILEQMESRIPPVVCLENVPSFATSHGGDDLARALLRLNGLGYGCDLLVVDARRFVPQSRPRLFIIGTREQPPELGDWSPSDLRPPWIQRFVERHPNLQLAPAEVHPPLATASSLADVVERLSHDDECWWDADRVGRFTRSLSPIQRERLARLRESTKVVWATAYRRTRHGRPVWEIRADAISGCLRTARGGSSKQALVEAGVGSLKVRWLTPREYARLQGVPDSYKLGAVSRNQALFGLGDAVCVPAVGWLAREYLRPAIERHLAHPVNECAAAFA